MSLHLDGAAEVVETAQEAADRLGFIAAVEVQRPEIAVRDAVAEHVVGGCEHGSGDGEDGFFGTAARLDAQKLSAQVVLSQLALFRTRVERRFPALSSLRGHKPAQETRWPAVGKRDISTPISATMT